MQTRDHHYCGQCGGIMHYGVRLGTVYSRVTGQPYGVTFMTRCENHTRVTSHHDNVEWYMTHSPFLMHYLRANPYILGVQTALDVYQEAY